MYAGDLIIFAKSMAAAQKMLDGVRGTFATAGLRVNPDQCHYLPKEGRHVRYQLSPVGANWRELRIERRSKGVRKIIEKEKLEDNQELKNYQGLGN